MTKGESDVMPLAKAAEQLDIDKTTAYRLAKKGEFPLPVLRVGSGFKVSRRALDRKLAELHGEAS
jgi:excisionase family DNA binding protein